MTYTPLPQERLTLVVQRGPRPTLRLRSGARPQSLHEYSSPKAINDAVDRMQNLRLEIPIGGMR